MAEVQSIDLGGVGEGRQARTLGSVSVHEFSGTYGEYLLGKVAKVFPELERSVL
jgi:hypothetical protein